MSILSRAISSLSVLIDRWLFVGSSVSMQKLSTIEVGCSGLVNKILIDFFIDYLNPKEVEI